MDACLHIYLFYLISSIFFYRYIIYILPNKNDLLNLYKTYKICRFLLASYSFSTSVRYSRYLNFIRFLVYNIKISNSRKILFYRLDANLKNNILCAALRNSNAEVWNRTSNVVKNILDEDERNNLSPILACSSSSEILKNYLLQTLEKNSSLSFSTVYRNIINEHPSGVDIVLNVLNDKYETL